MADRLNSLNRFFDALPRTRLRLTGFDMPAFRACGVVGFYCAVLITLAGGLLKGLSLPTLLLLALVCALSFFVYANLRKWLTGRENLVLLEHVWFALLLAALALFLLRREPVMAYLDVVSVGLSAFLAAGRVGCLLVGCCHGQPSEVGPSYGEEFVADGFPSSLVGVRLFPVAAIEALGLVIIGAGGLVALPFAAGGRVLVWFLLAYGVMRFGLEGLRGDARPHALGLSQARWMALAEILFALWLSQAERAPDILVYAILLASLAAWLVLRRVRDRWRTRLFATEHVREVHEAAATHLNTPQRDSLASPLIRRTSLGVCIGVSRGGVALPFAAHVSLSLPEGRCDLLLLCDLATRAFPELLGDAAQYTGDRVLHFPVPLPLDDARPLPATHNPLARELYGQVILHLQHRGAPEVEMVERETVETETLITEEAPPPLIVNAPMPGTLRPWYFAGVAERRRSGGA